MGYTPRGCSSADAHPRSLAVRLGVDWVDRGDGALDMACVPDTVREAFSSRTPQIEAKLAEAIKRWSDKHDGAEPDPRTIARLERSAVTDSRPGKVPGIDAGELHLHWADEARAEGFDPGRLVTGQIRGASRPEHRIPHEDLVDDARCRESATWLRADLARHLTTLVGPHDAASARELVAKVDQLATLAEQRCLGLGPERDTTPRRRRDGRPVTEAVTDRRLATPAVLIQEQAL